MEPLRLTESMSKEEVRKSSTTPEMPIFQSREGDRKRTNGETEKRRRFGSGMSDELSGDIAKSPKETRADDLRFHWMNRQASLVPSPKLYHYYSISYFGRRTARGRWRFLVVDRNNLSSLQSSLNTCPQDTLSPSLN
ncbi:uncharacterized protein LOC130499079 [Raphanus sativus]|uniref:Uncharacterized protein LOC130499079 n=1 Tax=Raphanus sativus TaxID=3726 RepID=A0A9W3CBU7_RAPSA|nr:uncharacterized protein LOC130499079 [Raphanus sativus]